MDPRLGKDKETIVTVIMFPSRTRPADLPGNETR